MDREKFGRAHLKTNQDLRDFLDYHSFPSYKEFASRDVSLALSVLHAYVDILCEMTKRLWDELEGHQDVCKIQRHIDEEMKKFIQGFGYRRELPEYTKFTGWDKSQRIEMKPCGYIDNDADDGWEVPFDASLKQAFKQSEKGDKMDKQIKKVEKDVKKGAKGKAMKDIKTLKKMDKKFDKKIDKAKKVMKKGC